METVVLTPKYRKGKKPTRIRKPSKPIDGINHRLLREQAQEDLVKEQLKENVLKEEPNIPDDNEKPSRREMVEKAKQLGLKFTKRTSDEKLLAMINEEIKG